MPLINDSEESLDRVWKLPPGMEPMDSAQHRIFEAVRPAGFFPFPGGSTSLTYYAATGAFGEKRLSPGSLSGDDRRATP